jgi:WD40 repeat protein
MTDLFISYSRSDAEFVRGLHAALEARDRRSWVDWDIPAITEWMPEIEQAIDAADNALFVLSPSWLASPICRRELDHAVAGNKRLIPLLCRPLDPDALPAALGKLNWIDFSDGDRWDESLDTLIEALDVDLDRKRTHSRLLQRARRWEASGEDPSQTLRGAELADAEAWLGADAEPLPTPLHTRYLTASRAAVTGRQRVTLAGVSLALIISIALGVMAWIQREIAEERRQVAEARRLAAESQLVPPDTPTDLERKLLLAVESLQLRRTLEGFTAWAAPAQLLLRRPLVLAHEGAVRQVAFSPDGTQLASATPALLRLWDSTTGALLFEQAPGARGRLVFDPGGRWLAAPRIGELRVWDTTTGEQIAGLAPERYGGILAMAVSEDGRHLVMGFHGGRIIVLDVPTDTPVLELETEGPVSALAIDPVARRLAGAVGRTVRTWAIDDGAPLQRFEHEAAVRALAFDADGTWLATGGSCPERGECRAAVVVWDLVTGEQETAQVLGGSVLGLRFRHQREELVAYGEASHVAVWRTDDWERDAFVPPSDRRERRLAVLDDTGRHLANEHGWWNVEEARELARLPTGRYAAFDFARDGSGRLAAATLDGEVRLFSPPTGGAVRRFEHSVGRSGQDVTAFDVDPAGRKLVTIGWDRTTRLWHRDTGALLGVLEHDNMPAIARFAPTGNWLAVAERCAFSASCDRISVSVVDTASGEEIASLPHDDSVSALAFSSRGARLATGTVRGAVAVYAPPGGDPVWTHRLEGRRDVRAVAFTPDERRLLVAEGCPVYSVCSASVLLWDLDSGTLLRSLSHDDGIRAMALSPDGQALATASSDLNVRLWDIDTGDLRWPAKQFVHEVNVLAISPDGRWLAAGGPSGPDGTSTGVLRVFDIASGEVRYAVPHEWPVADVAISDDSRWVTTVTGEDTRFPSQRGWRARVFALDSGEEASRLEQPEALTDVDFTPDGRWLLTAGWDQSAALWPWLVEDLIASACERLPRNFGVDEWQRYFPDEPYRCTCRGLSVPTSLPIRGDRRTLRVYREDSPAAEAWAAESPQPVPVCPP